VGEAACAPLILRERKSLETVASSHSKDSLFINDIYNWSLRKELIEFKCAGHPNPHNELLYRETVAFRIFTASIYDRRYGWDV
jgi:hypothetical protein